MTRDGPRRNIRRALTVALWEPMHLKRIRLANTQQKQAAEGSALGNVTCEAAAEPARKSSGYSGKSRPATTLRHFK